MPTRSPDALALQKASDPIHQKMLHMELSNQRLSVKHKKAKEALEQHKRATIAQMVQPGSGNKSNTNMARENIRLKKEIARLQELQFKAEQIMHNARLTSLEISSELMCASCFEALKEPRTLPCGHTYCGACLDEWYKRYPSYSRDADATAATIAGFCPECRDSGTPGASFRLSAIIPLVDTLKKQLAHRG